MIRKKESRFDMTIDCKKKILNLEHCTLVKTKYGKILNMSKFNIDKYL